MTFRRMPWSKEPHTQPTSDFVASFYGKTSVPFSDGCCITKTGVKGLAAPCLGRMGQRPYIRETMHSARNLSCTIRAQLISATRGHASQPKVLAMATDCIATCQQG